jgi:hypothetical protein
MNRTTLIILAAALFAGAQEPLDSSSTQSTGPLSYTAVVQTPGLTKAQLYAAGQAWFAKAFRSAKDVLQLQDAENGKLIGRGNFHYEPKLMQSSTGIRGFVRFDVTLEAKDGRYRYTFDRFVHEGAVESCSFGELTSEPTCPFFTGSMTDHVGPRAASATWVDLKAEARAHARTLIADLKDAMTSTITASSDSW